MRAESPRERIGYRSAGMSKFEHPSVEEIVHKSGDQQWPGDFRMTMVMMDVRRRLVVHMSLMDTERAERTHGIHVMVEQKEKHDSGGRPYDGHQPTRVFRQVRQDPEETQPHEHATRPGEQPFVKGSPGGRVQRGYRDGGGKRPQS